MKIFRRNKGEGARVNEPSSTENPWDGLGGDFDQEAAKENRRRAEAERVERSRTAQIGEMRREIVDKIAHGNKGYFYLEVQNGRVDDARKREFLNGVYAPRPVDDLETVYSRPSTREEGERQGMSPFDWACKTSFALGLSKMNETHYRRILLAFTGGDFNSPQDANENTYKKFVEKFETVFDFQDVSERFVNSIGVRRSDGSIDRTAVEKKNEYKRDMEEFKWLLFGGQMAVLKAFEELDKEAMDYQPEVTETDSADEATKEAEVSHGKDTRVKDSLREIDRMNREDEDPLIGQDLGGGHRCAVVGGFETNSTAEKYMKEYNYDNGYIAVRYEKTGKWYIVTK